MNRMIHFKGEILQPEKYPNAACVMVPGDVKQIFGRANPKVYIYFDEVHYRGSIANMGWGTMVIVPQKIRKQLAETHGDIVKVRIELDTEERLIEIPQILQDLLDKQPALRKVFLSLSYTNRKEMCRSITEAKREETIQKRLMKAQEKLQREK